MPLGGKRAGPEGGPQTHAHSGRKGIRRGLIDHSLVNLSRDPMGHERKHALRLPIHPSCANSAPTCICAHSLMRVFRTHLFSPSAPPAVLDQVVVVTLLRSIADHQHSVIEALAAAGDDPTTVEHHRLRGADADLRHIRSVTLGVSVTSPSMGQNQASFRIIAVIDASSQGTDPQARHQRERQ